MKRKLLSLCLAVTLLLTTLCLGACGKNAKAPEGTYTRMTVDINPSVEFMIDDQNKVIAATALNDDGSILIAGEAFVGKTPEEATELMVSLATETGYLVKGNAEANGNTVKISVSGDTKYAKKLIDEVEKKAKETLKELNVSATVEKIDAMTTDALRALALETTLFSEEEIAGMNDEQLCQAIAASRIETALLLTADMREAYYSAKETKISFAESQATAEIINTMGDLYALVYAGYSTALNAYGSAITAIDQFRYDNIASPDSEYQQTLQKLRNAKADLLKQRNYVASLEVDGEEYAFASVSLQVSEKNYNDMLAAYEALGASLDQALTSLVEALRQSEAMLRSIEENFSDNIKKELKAKATELEKAVNEAKSGFLADFEAAHKEDIRSMQIALIEQKNKLKEAATANAA